LEVKPNGKKAWRYRFKLNGKSSMFALGEYPTVKLAEAREKCEQARKQVADGVSPTQARQLDKIRKVNDASNTFELIAKEWL
ncbi:Arm DNA-binding domain-containing protein, partial [Escherichia coli]|nr:Arm DNA-binding domain-containing protein [Escherichia coli]